MVCGRPSSVSEKSSRLRLPASDPVLFRTVARTFTTFTSAEKTGASWPRANRAPHSAAAHWRTSRLVPAIAAAVVIPLRSRSLLLVKNTLQVGPEFSRQVSSGADAHARGAPFEDGLRVAELARAPLRGDGPASVGVGWHR